MSAPEIPVTVVVKAVAGWLGVDLTGADPVAVVFAVQQYEDQMRGALAAAYGEIRATAIRDAAQWLRNEMEEPWSMRFANHLDVAARREETGGSIYDPAVPS